MALTKISDSDLSRDKRFHANQEDIPKKSAAEMKAFMDYVPREVIIPKVNELCDEVNFILGESEGGDYSYSKAQVDEKLDEKADMSDVYTKEETDEKLGLKSDADSVYTKTEADEKLALKADSDNVYTKTETDNKFTAAAPADKIIECGETDGWVYRKYDSGICECFGSFSYTLDFSTAILSNTFYRCATIDLTFPEGLFKSILCENLNVARWESAQVYFAHLLVTGSSKMQFFISRTTSATNIALTVSVSVTGKWR